MWYDYIFIISRLIMSTGKSCTDFYYFFRIHRKQLNCINLSQFTDKLYHIILYWVHLAWAGFKFTTLVVIGTDCIGSYKYYIFIISRLIMSTGKSCTDFYYFFRIHRKQLNCMVLFSSTNKTNCHDITEILLKVVLNTIGKKERI
jgi:hypothetical protein